MAAMREPLGTYEQSGTVKLGPFLSEADGKTPITDLTINQANVQLSKNSAAFAQKNDASAAVHDNNGWYDIALNETDLDAIGFLVVAVDMGTALPVWRKFSVELFTNINEYSNYYSGQQEEESEVE